MSLILTPPSFFNELEGTFSLAEEEFEVDAVFFVGCDPEDGFVLLSGDAMAGGVADLGPSSAR